MFELRAWILTIINSLWESSYVTVSVAVPLKLRSFLGSAIIPLFYYLHYGVLEIRGVLEVREDVGPDEIYRV